MACPVCGCQTAYPFDDKDNPLDDRLQRCAACGEVFDLEDQADEGDDDMQPCPRCHGDGMDPLTDYLLVCPACQGEQR